MKTLWITFLCLFIVTTSCFSENSKTDLIKEDLHLSGFNTIHKSASITLILKQGDKEAVIMVTNLVLQIQVLISVEKGVLNVKLKGKVINPTEFTTLVTLPKQKDINSNCSTDIRSVGLLTSPVLNFNINGSYNLYNQKHKAKKNKVKHHASGHVLKGVIEKKMQIINILEQSLRGMIRNKFINSMQALWN